MTIMNDDVNGADQFEKHVTHFYDFISDKLIIGKFCAIAKGVEFVMNGANHRMDCVTTYPFYIMGGDWGYDMDITSESLKEDNHYYVNGFAQYGEPVMLIDINYEDTIKTIIDYIDLSDNTIINMTY